MTATQNDPQQHDQNETCGTLSSFPAQARRLERSADGYAPIGDYGFLSDCRSSALVASDGSIDWLCWPRFDSPSVFAKILDVDEGGTFAVTPSSPYTVERSYVPRTNVLQTTFYTASGVVRVSDWLHTGARQAICRLIECVEGEVELAVICDPRPSYALAAEVVWAERLGYLVCQTDGGNQLILDGMGAPRETVTLSAGECKAISLGWNRPGPSDLFAARERAVRFWEEWAGDLTVPNGVSAEIAAHVARSALTLKGLQYEPSGAFVAAATTSLPEEIGGTRNWDYRYSWLRDSTFTLYALRSVGKVDEAQSWLDWVNTIAFSEDSLDLQIVYGIDGSPDLPEAELSHLAGHRGSRPVRVGNGAADQRQLDVYGELADSIWIARCKSSTPLHRTRWELVKRLAERTIAEWRLPDEGIWEVRGASRHFVYSKVMCWVALDRALRLARKDGYTDAPLERWRAERDAIKADVLEHGYDEQLGAFTQSYGSGTLDAANLLLAQVGFVSRRDRRFVSTVRATQRDLARNGLVDRYRDATDDGCEHGEGTFTICTFWLCLALQQIGAREEALALFEQTLAHANDLGLLSEELSPDGEQLGNFPQAFTHIALIVCAFALSDSTAVEQPLRLNSAAA
ncbi:MAG TPA: glycoside hydrolase family 15 protein [Gaiellaceae bacterium]|nr:glycoside hydrolase family 15 protein [Gaiellaceae bacterium]